MFVVVAYYNLATVLGGWYSFYVVKSRNLPNVWNVMISFKTLLDGDRYQKDARLCKSYFTQKFSFTSPRLRLMS